MRPDPPERCREAGKWSVAERRPPFATWLFLRSNHYSHSVTCSHAPQKREDEDSYKGWWLINSLFSRRSSVDRAECKQVTGIVIMTIQVCVCPQTASAPEPEAMPASFVPHRRSGGRFASTERQRW